MQGVDQLDQRGMLPKVGYPLALVLVVHGVVATAVISSFHGTRGKQRAWPFNVGVLAVLAKEFADVLTEARRRKLCRPGLPGAHVELAAVLHHQRPGHRSLQGACPPGVVVDDEEARPRRPQPA